MTDDAGIHRSGDAEIAPAYGMITARTRPGACSGQAARTEWTALMFSVATHRRADTICMAVIGKIDLRTTRHLERTLAAALASDARVITVDLSATTFCDCAGINTLLTAYHHAQARNVRYRITNPRRVVRRVLDVLNLDDVLTGR